MLTLKKYPIKIDLEQYPADFSPCHRRVLAARGIACEHIKKSLSQLLDVDLLTNAKNAAQRIYEEIQRGDKIVIVGDYDTDGATAVSVMMSVFRHLGANVDYIVPNRMTMGYGLSEKAVSQVITKGAQLLITVDNGITASDSVDVLIDKNIDVIITDHHIPPKQLPAATFIVNPNCHNCNFPSKALSGVGVAFYMMLALRQVYREHNNHHLNDYSLANLLPLVAIGTIADVVPLDFNNRILVEQGLRRIRAKRCSNGILALISASGLLPDNISTMEIAFQVAPRLNAASRIADMQLGVDCLLATNEMLATDYALELDGLNRERKAIENEMKIDADKLLKSTDKKTEKNCICLYDDSWNEGLIGILASRLKDKYYKTSFVFTCSSLDKSLLKASARSSQGVNVIDALNRLNSDFPNILHSFGGHAKVAGLTLNKKNLELFSTEIESILTSQIEKIDSDDSFYTDGELLPYEFSLENALFLKTLEPWGQDIPEPLFENTFRIGQIREVGKNHAQLKMIESSSNIIFKGIAFDKFAHYDSFSNQECRVAYQLSVNEWKAQKNLNLVVKHMALTDKHNS